MVGGAPRFASFDKPPPRHPSCHLFPAREAETDPLDLVGPPGRRCGDFFLVETLATTSFWRNCWSGIRGDDGARPIGRPMMMPTSPGGAAALVAPATAGRGEVGGLRRSIDKFRGTDTGLTLRRLLTPTFRLENLLVFIPLRVVAAESGAAQFDRRGRRISFVLVELLIGAAGRRWSSGGRAVEVRGRGRVAGGRSSGQGGSASSAHSDFPAGKSAGLYPFAGGGRQIWRGAVRPARAADFVRFSGIVDRRCGATMELGRSGC